MHDGKDTGEQPALAPPQQEQPQSDAPSVQIASVDRTDLVEKARAFLASPQVRHANIDAKRRFLADKGLNDVEVDSLLNEMPSQPPTLPPRTYPQPPPSNLPTLLLGMARIMTWLAGGSAALLLVYFRFLYPKIAQTFQARHSLQANQRELLARLTTSLQSLKETQAATSAVLPRPEHHADPHYGHCQSLEEVAAANEGKRDVPGVTLLRCALSDLSKEGKKATAEEVFAALQTKLPWLAEEDSAPFLESLWHTLSTNPLFHHTESDPSSRSPSEPPTYSYVPPTPPPPPQLLASLSTLKSAFPLATPSRPSTPTAPNGTRLSRFHHTLQALTDLTGFISTQSYAAFRQPHMGFAPASLSIEEEEVRKEIRALKGLVLNRKTFMASIPRPPSRPSSGFSADTSATP